MSKGKIFIASNAFKIVSIAVLSLSVAIYAFGFGAFYNATR